MRLRGKKMARDLHRHYRCMSPAAEMFGKTHCRKFMDSRACDVNKEHSNVRPDVSHCGLESIVAVGSNREG